MNRAETTTNIRYGPSYGRLALLIFIGVILSVVGFWWLSALGAGSSEIWPIVTLSVGVFFTVLIVSAVFRGRPFLTLSPEGIEYSTIYRSRFHSWRDVGVFAARTRRIQHNTTRLICAYSDTNHDALHRGRLADTTVGVYDADITFDITNLKVGRAQESAEALAVEVNNWRNRYGAPEDNAYHLTVDEVEALRKKKKRKNMWVNLVVIVIVFIGIAVKIFF